MRAACYNFAMPKTTKRKKYVSIRIDEETYQKLRRIAYKTNMKLIDVLREQYVAGVPLRKGA